MKVYADTNVLARLLLKDNLEQLFEAQRWLDGYGTGEILILDGVFVELFFFIEAKNHYHLPRATSSIFFEVLMEIPQLSISALAVAAYDVFKNHPKLDFMDCLLAAAADRKADKLLTFDKDLQKILA